MEDPIPRLPLLRIMLGNATLLSVVYLAFGLLLELLRRFYAARAPERGLWVERAWEGLDQLPGRVLELLGLLTPLRDGYLAGKVSELGLRLAFAATAVTLIFALALVVGGLMWMVRGLFFRQATSN